MLKLAALIQCLKETRAWSLAEVSPATTWQLLKGGMHSVLVLFGRDGLGEVPQFERVVLGHGDQTRLDRMEGQRSDTVKMAPQCVLRVPRLPERRLLIGRQLGLTNDRECGYSLSVNAAEECVCVCVLHRSYSRFRRWWRWGQQDRPNPARSPTRRLTPPTGRTSHRREETVEAPLQRENPTLIQQKNQIKNDWPIIL